MRLVCFLLHLSSPGARNFRSRGVQTPRAQPLAGSLPFGVRTFLPRINENAAAITRPALLRGTRIIANHR